MTASPGLLTAQPPLSEPPPARPRGRRTRQAQRLKRRRDRRRRWWATLAVFAPVAALTVLSLRWALDDHGAVPAADAAAVFAQLAAPTPSGSPPGATGGALGAGGGAPAGPAVAGTAAPAFEVHLPPPTQRSPAPAAGLASAPAGGLAGHDSGGRGRTAPAATLGLFPGAQPIDEDDGDNAGAGGATVSSVASTRQPFSEVAAYYREQLGRLAQQADSRVDEQSPGPGQVLFSAVDRRSGANQAVWIGQVGDQVMIRVVRADPHDPNRRAAPAVGP